MKKIFTRIAFYLSGILGLSLSAAAQRCDVVYADNDVVLASIDQKMYRSTDGGLSFAHIFLAGEDNVEVRCITKINSTLIVGGINGNHRIFRSTDNGASWSASASGMPMIGTVVTAVPVQALTHDGRVFMGGTNFAKYSDDEGATWVTIPGVDALTNAIKYDGGRLWHSSYGKMKYSTDKGATWTATASTPLFGGGAAVGYASFDDTLVILSQMGAGTAVKRTYDNGATWKTETALSMGLDMIDVAGTLYATSYDGFMKSTDHGVTWEQICTLFEYNAYGGKMCVHNDDIWIASNNGIVRYDISTGTCSAIEATHIVEKGGTTDVSIYPNPAAEYLKIESLVPGARLRITDITGKVCYSGVVQNTALTIRTADFTDGLYLLSILSGEENITKKLVLRK